MTFTTKHSALMIAALIGATLSTAAMAEKGPMGFNFETMDTDKDGKITKAEIAAHRSAKFTEADADKDGKLSADEMIAMHEKVQAARKAKMAAKMIGHIDTDKDGLVSAEEMAAMPMMDKMFDRVDADKDGAVSMEEMTAMQANMGKHKGDHKGGHGKHGGGFWGWMGGDN